MQSIVIQFPGSNCERDVFTVMQQQGLNPQLLWHQESDIPADIDLVVLPGGFSYGDYLRCGAMAARSPIMDAVRRFADDGGHVLGICNGFQILCETQMLPGTLMRNDHLKFNCKPVSLRVENAETNYSWDYAPGEVVTMPIAHHEGFYYADDDTIATLKKNRQIFFRYCDETGNATPESNPNGSRSNIAGILNERGNVLGMMPHPERHADPHIGGIDGQRLFTSLLARLN
jgi:phosphoribosylformylglycinamidine synthase I